ncbi:MAG: DUF6884 domain-containing protein [Candidatus Nanohaloarchaea archaeon]
MEIGLVSCSKSKKDEPSKPGELYTESALFRKAKRHAENKHDNWFILSAKHHLLDPEGEEIEPYDETLRDKGVDEKKQWSRKVLEQLKENDLLEHQLVIHAGKDYYKYLLPLLEEAGATYRIPTKGLSQGQTMRWYNIEYFYYLMERLEQKLGGKRKLENCDGFMDWPERGVYFFFSPDETRENSNQLRLTRVGTHAVSEGSSTTLWNRLKQHYGTGDGSENHPHGGNHRGSVYRKRVGEAIINKEDIQHTHPSWNQRWSSIDRDRDEVRDEEYPLEKRVSEFIRKQPFLWLEVDDEPGKNSDRAKIEQGVIALISNFQKKSIDPRDEKWLGKDSLKKEIRESGLWNVNHVDEDYSSEFLVLLEEKIEKI